MNNCKERTTRESRRHGAALLILFAISILLAFATVFVASLPGYAAATTTEIWEQDGNVILTPQAAKDLLMGLRELRAENEELRSSLESERAATAELIASVQELRTQIQQERQLSQETIALLQRQIRTEKHRTKTIGLIGAVGILAALIL